MLRFKRFFCAIFAGTLILSMGTNVMAQEGMQSKHTTSIQKFAKNNQITVDETINLSENISKALKLVSENGEITLNGNETKVIPVSDNLVLEFSAMSSDSIDSSQVKAVQAATVYERTITSTLKLKNIVGGTIITLNSVGVFETDGKTSNPTDAYGTYDAIVWNVTNTDSEVGSEQYNAWAKNSFSGELNIGIDPVDMTIQSFAKTCKIYCNAVGTYSASWN